MSQLTNAERDLVDTVLALKDVYVEDGVRLWLAAANVQFDGMPPIQLIRDGDGSRVVQRAWQLADGAYA